MPERCFPLAAGQQPRTRSAVRPLPAGRPCCWLIMALLCAASAPTWLPAASLNVEVSNDVRVTFLGAIGRWDADGNPRRPVDPKAKVDAPWVDAVAKQETAGRWVFSQLPAPR